MTTIDFAEFLKSKQNTVSRIKTLTDINNFTDIQSIMKPEEKAALGLLRLVLACLIKLPMIATVSIMHFTWADITSITVTDTSGKYIYLYTSGDIETPCENVNLLALHIYNNVKKYVTGISEVEIRQLLKLTNITFKLSKAK